MVKENSFGKMEVITTENLGRMFSMGLAITDGTMEENTKVHGVEVQWMVLVKWNGKIIENIKDNLKMICYMVEVKWSGQMDVAMMANGIMENNME